MQLLVRVCVESVKVMAIRVSYMLATDNSIWVEHGDYDEHILMEERVLSLALIS